MHDALALQIVQSQGEFTHVQLDTVLAERHFLLYVVAQVSA
jgi:hypothetical protein